METTLTDVLRNTLDELSGTDFKRFKHKLKDQNKIPWGKLEKADTDDTVDMMVQMYTTEAGSTTVVILKQMNQNKLATDLETSLEKLGSQQCSPGQAGGGGGGVNMNIAAHSGGMVNAPALSGCTITGPANFTIYGGGMPMVEQGAGCMRLLSDTFDFREPSISQTAHSEDTEPSTSNRTNGCKSCIDIAETSQWTMAQPYVTVERGVLVYKHHSEAGSFECTVTRFRWVCSEEVSLQYHFSDPEIFKSELAKLQYMPIGPLIDITVLTGELLEAHFPHFVCLEKYDSSLRDAVRVLDGHNGSVSLETCELTRFHARLLKPTFSLKQVLVEIGIPFKVHLDVLIYQTRVTPLVLYIYVVPRDISMIKAVKEDLREYPNAKNIKKHRPDISIWMDSTYSLMSTNNHASISPSEITLKYINPPDFFNVVNDSPGECFDLQLVSKKRIIWEATLKRFEYNETGDVAQSPESPETSLEPRHSQELRQGNRDFLATSGASINAPRISDCTFTKNIGRQQQPGGAGGAASSGEGPGKAFFDQHKYALETRLCLIQPILGYLEQHGAISRGEREQVQSKATNSEKNKALIDCLEEKGARAQEKFYEALQVHNKYLVDDLEYPE